MSIHPGPIDCQSAGYGSPSSRSLQFGMGSLKPKILICRYVGDQEQGAQAAGTSWYGDTDRTELADRVIGQAYKNDYKFLF